MGNVENKKQQKRDSLLESAFSLFLDNGFSKTSISDIVSHAGVAKGTFYLYFKDKYDIRNHLIAHKANQVFRAAYVELHNHPQITDFEEQVLFIADHILDQLDQNHNLVMLLSKHLTWGFFKNSLYISPGDDTDSVYTIYESLLAGAQYSYRSPEMMMYLILELCGASYNAILYQQPTSLSELKPHLYATMRSIFRQYRVEPAKQDSVQKAPD